MITIGQSTADLGIIQSANAPGRVFTHATHTMLRPVLPIDCLFVCCSVEDVWL